MIVDAILEAAVALRIRAGHSPDLQRRSIWENDVCPDDKHPRLTEGDLGIIAPEELCSLRNEQLMAGGAVRRLRSTWALSARAGPELMPVISIAGMTEPRFSS